MLLHFQLQELKTEDVSGSVLTALRPYFDSSKLLDTNGIPKYLGFIFSYPTHSHPLGCWGSGHARRYCCWMGGMRAGLGQALECGDTQLLLWAGRPCPSGTTRTQNSLYTAFLVHGIPCPVTCPLSAPARAASSLGHLAAFVHGSILYRLKCQAARMIHPGKMYAFALFLSFFLSLPLNPTAAKEETMLFINTDGTTLLLRQICG